MYHGMNGDDGGVYGFISNSHCSNQIGSVDGSDAVLDETVADETADPAWRFGGGGVKRAQDCAVLGENPLACRDSDSAFYTYRSSVTAQDIQFGKIHRTDDRSSGSPGGLDVVGVFSMNAEASSHLVGTELEKVGQKTGWTYGDITFTDTDIISQLANRWYLSQVVAAVHSNKGDSGSPVFHWPNHSSENVTIYGVLWGGPEDENGNPEPDTSYYSPISTVMRDTNVDDVF